MWDGGPPARALDLRAREPRRVRWQRIDEALSRYTPTSALALVHAALDSPNAGHRAPSLMLLWRRLVCRPPAGTADATAEDLPGLLATSRRACAGIAWGEDFWPGDPRLVVTAEIAGTRLRLHPGAVVDVKNTVAGMKHLAWSVDAVAQDLLGFRLTDLLEVGLRLADAQSNSLALVWPRERPEPPNLHDSAQSPLRIADDIASFPAVVTPPEIFTAAGSLERDLTAGVVDACDDPASAAAALEWLTVDCAQLARWPGTAPLQHLAVRTPAGSVPMPASQILSTLHAAAAYVAAICADDAEAQFRYAELSARHLSERLGVAEPPADQPLQAGGVLAPAERHLVAVDYATDLDVTRMGEVVDAAVQRAAGRSIDEILLATGDGQSGREVDVTRIVVACSPGRLRWSGSAAPVLVVDAGDLISVMDDARDGVLGISEGWDFLFDLARLPPGVELRAPDLVDAWTHWRDNGGFVTPDVNWRRFPDALVVTGWSLHDPSWAKAAAWEVTERLLAAARLPPVAAYAAAELDDQGAATLWPPPARTGGQVTCYALHPSGLVCIGTTTPDDNRNAAQLVVHLAAALRDALLQRPQAAAALNLDPAEPWLVGVDVDHDADYYIGLAHAHDGRLPVVILGRRLLHELAFHPQAGHARIGDALIQAAQLVGKPVDVAAFTAAWTQGPPLIVTQVTPAAAAARQGRLLPRTRACQSRAYRAYFDELRARDPIAPGTYTGQAAAALCREVLAPAAQAALIGAVRKFDGDALIRAAGHYLDEGLADRAHRRGQLDLALAAPWRADVLADPTPYLDDAWLTRPLQALLETALTAGPAAAPGRPAPDRFDVADLAEQAALLVRIGTAAEAHRRGLTQVAVTVHADGIALLLDAIDEDDLRGVDMPAFVAASQAHGLRVAAAAARPQTEQEIYELADVDLAGTTRAFTSLVAARDVPGSLLAVNARMKEVFGTGMDGIAAVLAIAAEQPSQTPGSSRHGSNPITLVDEATSWAGIDRFEAEGALRLLSFDAARANADAQPIWEIETRITRLTISPLISVNDGLLILPHLVAAAREVIIANIGDGRLPWSYDDELLRRAVGRYRQAANRELERRLEDEIAALGLPFRMHVEQHEAAAAGIPALPGEIDALVADPANRRVWVLEAKDVRLGLGPRRLEQRIAEFTKPNTGHFDKLLAKTAQLRMHRTSAVALAGAEGDDTWEVLPLIVTRRVEPAAFLRERPLAVTALAELGNALRPG